MTEFFTFWGKSRTAQTQIVHIFSAVLLTTCGAQAGAWEEFEARCLVPMENVALEPPVDVKADKNFKNDGDTYSEFELGEAKLRINDGRADHARWCDVVVRGTGAVEFMDAGMAWRSAALESGRYVETETRVLGFVLRSTEWREPKLDVSMTMAMKGGQFTLRAEETDLES